jgi:low affinity Fe/Cu permease
MNELFRRFAHTTADKVGSPTVFLAGLIVVLIWAVSGPIFHYSDTWQLVINTGTTIITFLMVFLIQNTQNRDARAMHLKLDELIRASNARNIMVGLETCTDEELSEIANEFAKIRERVLARSKKQAEEKNAATSER